MLLGRKRQFQRRIRVIIPFPVSSACLVDQLLYLRQQLFILALKFLVISLHLFGIHFEPLQNIDLYLIVTYLLPKLLDNIPAITRLSLIIEFLKDTILIHRSHVQLRQICILRLTHLALITNFEFSSDWIFIVTVLFTWLIGKYRCLGSISLLFLGTSQQVSIFRISITMTFNFISLYVSLLKFLVELHVQSKHHIQLTLLRLPLTLQDSNIILVHHMLISKISLQLIQLLRYSSIFFLNQMQLFTQEYVLVCYFTNICLSFYQKLLQQLKVFCLSLQGPILRLQNLNFLTQVRNFIQILLNFVLMSPIVVAFQFVHQTQDRIVHSVIHVLMALIGQDV